MENEAIYTKLELLEKHLDGLLSQQEEDKLKKELENTPALKKELEILQVARDAIRSKGISDKVRSLHDQLITEIKPVRDGGKVIELPQHRFKWVIRIAASLFIAMIGYGFYQYSTLNPDDFYTSNFVSYQLPVTRSMEGGITTLDSLYVAGNYTGVTGAFEHTGTKNSRDYFMSAVSQMQLGSFEKAIGLFRQLEVNNKASEKQYFEQEIDYYLALAYLKNGNTDEALALFKKIRQDPAHMYHSSVSGKTILKLRILDWKK